MIGKHDYALIMAGGSGTRLWPLSRRGQPKQFQKLVGDVTLIQVAYKSLLGYFPKERIFVVAPDIYWKLIKEQLPDLNDTNFIAEPEARDTAPAFAYAAATIEHLDANARVGVFYADNFVGKSSWPAFHKALETGFSVLSEQPDQMLLFGVLPLYAHTGLGYMKRGEVIHQVDDVQVCKIEFFVEKPQHERAVEMLTSGKYLWNTGYKLVKAKRILELVSQSDPKYKIAVKQLCSAIKEQDVKKKEEAFKSMPCQSFEYLVTEQLQKMLTLVVDIEWSDVGDWDIVHRLQALEGIKPSSSGVSCDGAKVGRVVEKDCDNTLIISNSRPIVGIGLKDLVVVETADAVLVMHKDSNQNIKEVLRDLLQMEPELA